MTHVFGFARDPDDGDPLVGCEVRAELYPRTATPFPPIEGGRDRFVTGLDGRWELTLPSTAGSDTLFRIREWRNRLFFIQVPDTDDDTPMNVEQLIVDPTTGDPPPDQGATMYLTRVEAGAPGGVATLGTDGLLTESQRAGGGTGPSGPPVVDWFAGNGPPNGTIPGAGLGDMYQDLDDGQLYQLR